MLKDAALLTLNIQKIALDYNMVLKDASAYNVQFIGSSPIFIDTLSFEKYMEGKPWIGYGQFCRHFLAPLALMAYQDVSLNRLSIPFLDGIPLDLAAKLMPFRSKFNLGLYLHLFLHAKTQNKNKDKKVNKGRNTINRKSLLQLIEHLISTIEGLKWHPGGTEWDEYYKKSVADTYFDSKQKIIHNFLKEIKPKTVLDLGANDGTFSRIAAQYAERVLSFDIDPTCVEQNYLALKKENRLSITPLVVDVTNPEPAIGWDNNSRHRPSETGPAPWRPRRCRQTCMVDLSSYSSS